MNTKQTSSLLPMIFANRPGRFDQLRDWLGHVFLGKNYCLVSVYDNASPQNDAFENVPRTMTRALIVFETLPIEMNRVAAWRNWAMDRGAWEVHVAFLGFFSGSDEQKFKAIMKLCRQWSEPIPEPEQAAVQKGQFVTMSSDPEARNLSTLLTMTIGSMGDLLTRMELLARRFHQAIPTTRGGPDKVAVEQYLNGVDSVLKGDLKPADSQPALGTQCSADGIPKLLLCGDSGVGKSLIAKYLHTKLGWTDGIARVAIPEYLGKEDMFEYDLFGYCRGAYTDGKAEGSRGRLLVNTGRVVFLDEIGEANEYLQAKLLAFLDDYLVRPRGWEGEGFYCPVLIVAATNKDIVKMVEKKAFRGDLLARFTDRHTIPGLHERIGDLPFILDCLLQRNSMNPGGKIREVGSEAFEAIRGRQFKEGNFRELETLFRIACEHANRESRDFLVKSDIG